MPKADRSLLRHPEFLKLWTAETISQLGSQMTLLALPLFAITVLRASTVQVALLGTIEFLPFVLLGLSAGAWIDRLPPRPVLIACDLGRALALGLIPLAYHAHVLSVPLVYGVAFVTGSFTVFFDVAYEAYLPSLINRERLVEGNSRLEMSRSAAMILGPTLAGPLVDLTSASVAILIDVVSFVLSAGCVFWIRGGTRWQAIADATPASAQSLWRESREGLRYVLGHPHLRSIAACTATSNLFQSLGSAILLVYLTREVHIAPFRIGLIMGIGNVGLALGAVSVNRLSAWLGIGPALISGMLLCGGAALIIPLAPPPWAPVSVATAQCLSGFATTLYNVNQISLRQSLAPPHLRGRVNATMRFMVWGTIPIGSAVGGALGASLGLRSTLWIAALGGLTAFLWVFWSPVRELQRIPSAPRADASL